MAMTMVMKTMMSEGGQLRVESEKQRFRRGGRRRRRAGNNAVAVSFLIKNFSPLRYTRYRENVHFFWDSNVLYVLFIC